MVSRGPLCAASRTASTVQRSRSSTWPARRVPSSDIDSAKNQRACIFFSGSPSSVAHGFFFGRPRSARFIVAGDGFFFRHSARLLSTTPYCWFFLKGRNSWYFYLRKYLYRCCLGYISIFNIFSSKQIYSVLCFRCAGH